MVAKHDSRFNLERFWLSVDRTGGPESCWPWRKGRFANGYGCFRADGRNHRAHRWLLGHLRGSPLGKDEYGCHHCDNPPCCNPKHLFIGSAKDNAQDMASKGRSRGQRTKCCPQGHEYTADNTYWSNDGQWRRCRTCVRERMRVPGALPCGERTRCPQGHEYDEENTYVSKAGTRHCRACDRDRQRARRKAKAA